MPNQNAQEQVLKIADDLCRWTHNEYYDSLICIGPNPSGFGPPCDGCRDKMEMCYKTLKGEGGLVPLTEEEIRHIRNDLGVQ
jgi:hypothetical protein